MYELFLNYIFHNVVFFTEVSRQSTQCLHSYHLLVSKISHLPIAALPFNFIVLLSVECYSLVCVLGHYEAPMKMLFTLAGA